MKRIVILLFAALSISNVRSQRVELDFPHFAGQEYHFWVFCGEGKDTIASGRLDEQGKGRLSLPERLKGYRGMTQWMLAGGGGLDIIFAGEGDFSVACAEARPSEENIVYTGSPENTYLPPRYRLQQTILEKIDAMRMASEAFQDDRDLAAVFNAELRKQEQAYNRLQKETAASPLYAARFARIVDITRGLPPALPADREEAGRQMKDFILNELDMSILYTSGHWAGVLGQFLGWYVYKEENKPLFIPDVIRLLSRTRPDEVYAALAEKVITICEQQSWYDQEIELAFFLLNDDRIKKPTGKYKTLMTLFNLSKGSEAPALASGDLQPGKTLLVFYETGCSNCDRELKELRDNYDELKAEGYEVVSVSADTDPEVFQNTAKTLPWACKYQDPEGLGGKDFTNYGVVGTPTIYLIDEEGRVQGRHARLIELRTKN